MLREKDSIGNGTAAFVEGSQSERGLCRVKGGCGRKADGTAVCPQLQKYPSVPTLTLRAISGHRVATIAISRDAQPGNSSGALTASNVLPPCVRVIAGDPSALRASRAFISGIWAERTPSEEGIKRMGS